MKTNFIRHRIAFAVAGCACSAMMTVSGVSAANSNPASKSGAPSSQTSASRKDRSGPDVEKVRVTRASTFLGSDVIAKDGRKVGDIVDYYFDPASTAHLAYVVIMTGGFLNLGGDARAVPAAALSSSGDNCRINLTSAQYWDVPVLPENRQRFLSDPQHRERISRLFSQAGRVSDQQTTDASNTKTSANKRADDPNRAGAMTGRASDAGAPPLISFNQLRNTEAYSSNGERLGYFMDAWINLNDNRAPYVEITPTFEPFRTTFDRRHAIPTAKLAQKREYYGYTVNVTTDELNKAEWVSETEGVKMLEDGRFGNAVLRVTVPEK